MTWRLAKSLTKLREQVNAKYPNRDKSSDGSIGDAAHASRSSDHNPWVKDGKTGIVTAVDITNDPKHGLSSEGLAEALRLSGDARLKYIISNKKIASYDKGWKWRKYTGSNPHDHHCHISVRSDKARYDSEADWDLNAIHGPTVIVPPTVPTPVLHTGSTGPFVVELQLLLGGLVADGDFGPKTQAAVIKFQKAKGLVADGIVGVYTWAALKK